ncbi:MAG TPA: cupin domain-containing protein [Candidatus Limnocylindrales bacterium]|nr:cupin domain-containing protein [Candidatus Limnocylindrales bacterium]
MALQESASAAGGGRDPLARQIRHLRRAKRLTLRALADRAGVTESFLSQVERGITSPSISTLRRIATGLDESIGSLFADDAEPGRVTRKSDRRVIDYPGLRARDEFLTRSRDGRLQVIESIIEPGGGTGDEAYAHESDEECVIVLEGSLDIWIDDVAYHLETGDSITHSSRLPHRNRNAGAVRTRVLFILTPPSY